MNAENEEINSVEKDLVAKHRPFKRSRLWLRHRLQLLFNKRHLLLRNFTLINKSIIFPCIYINDFFFFRKEIKIYGKHNREPYTNGEITFY